MLRGEISINGLIGPGLGERVEELLTAHRDVSSIVISSPGGLVDEALLAARIIEKHNGMIVRATGECNSACLLLLSAGSIRQADWQMELGFHAVSPIVPDSLMELSDVQSQAEESSLFLTSRGVPNDIIAKANEIGPANLHLVSAIELKDRGFLNSLTDSASVIPLSQAKWLYVEAAMGSKAMAAKGLLAAIRENASDVMQQHAEALYSSVKSGNVDAVSNTVRALVIELTPRSVYAASADDVHQYVRATHSILSAFANSYRWKACANFANGKAGLAEMKLLPQELVTEELNSISRMVISAGESEWKRKALPSEMPQRLQELTVTVAENFAAQSLTSEDLNTDRGVCLFAKEMAKTLTSLAPQEGASMFRYLLTPEVPANSAK